MSAAQIAADLLTAANHIETFGHRKHHYGRQGEPCCASGAIQIAVYGGTAHDLGVGNSPVLADPDRSLRLQAAQAELMWHLDVKRIPAWNDAPERTPAQVVAAFRAAAERVSPGSTADGRADL